MNCGQTIKCELNQYNDQKKAGFLPNFLKAYPSGYGEGDEFIGVDDSHNAALCDRKI